MNPETFLRSRIAQVSGPNDDYSLVFDLVEKFDLDRDEAIALVGKALYPASSTPPSEDRAPSAAVVAMDGPKFAPEEPEPDGAALPHGRALTEGELAAVPALRWEHDGWTQRSGCTLIVGPPGSYKTLMVAALLGASATGAGTGFGVQAQRRGPVYAVVGEDLAGWSARWQAWRRASGIPANVTLPLFTFADSVNVFTGEHFDALLADVESVDPIVIGIDPLSEFITGGEENSAKDMSIVRERFKKLMGGRRTLLVAAHTGWDETRERGSSIFRAFSDGRIVLRANDHGEVLVRCKKARNGRPFDPVTLRFNRDALVLERNAETPVPRLCHSRGTEVLGWVQEHPDVTTDAVARGLGRRKADVIATLKELDSAGAVRPRKQGRGTTWRAV